MRWLLGVFLACFVSMPAGAQAIDFAKWSGLCRAGAEKPASPLAENIAAVARRERDIFRGHVVDASGRIVRYGNAEAESDQSDGRRTADRADIPWYNVQRYWNNLAGATGPQLGADDTQGVTYYPNLTETRSSAVEKKSVSLKRLLRIIQNLDIPADNGEAEAIREALRESVMRASISDTAWSAAFISSVMDDAGVPRTKFTRSANHISYITEAVKRALADIAGEPGEGLYRACDPFNTRARVGDLICFRRDPYTPRDGVSLHRSLMLDIASGNRPISLSHCEIVVGIDHEKKKITSVGGNVQQSVTERTLNMNRQGLLSTSQGATTCGPYSSKDGGANCNLNNQAWFALLQTR